MKTTLTLFRDAAKAWGQDKASMLAAALAYYAIFSLAPMLVFAIGVAGLVLGETAVTGELFTQIEGAVGSEAALFIQGMIQNANQSGGGGLATTLSTVVLLLGASGVFNQLKNALHRIWGITTEPIKGLPGILNLLKTRAVTFALVLAMGLLLLGTLALNAVAAAVGERLAEIIPLASVLLPYVNLVFAPLILLLLFAMLFKSLPDAKIAWRDVWLGAAVTTLLFAIGISLIGLYLGRGGVGSVFGAASSLIILLLWIYYSAQIFLFGAEFIKVYAIYRGRQIVPSNAPDPIRVWPDTPDQFEREVIFEEEAVITPPSALPNQARKQVATGLIGIAVGLLVAFVGNFRRGK